jgi:hypothetical protein
MISTNKQKNSNPKICKKKENRDRKRKKKVPRSKEPINIVIFYFFFTNPDGKNESKNHTKPIMKDKTKGKGIRSRRTR